MPVMMPVFMERATKGPLKASMFIEGGFTPRGRSPICKPSFIFLYSFI